MKSILTILLMIYVGTIIIALPLLFLGISVYTKFVLAMIILFAFLFSPLFLGYLLPKPTKYDKVRWKGFRD